LASQKPTADKDQQQTDNAKSNNGEPCLSCSPELVDGQLTLYGDGCGIGGVDSDQEHRAGRMIRNPVLYG
jgi:hypothetical protein